MEFYGITDFFTYLMGVIAVILLPGPNSMYCLYVASSRGVADGYKVIIAILIADTLLMLAATLGAATLLQASPLAFGIFKGLGSLYLLYLGYGLLSGAYRNLCAKKANNKENVNKKSLDEANTIQKSSVSKTENVFLKAFVLGLSNPKAIVFFLSFFLQFVNPNYENTLLSFAILGMTLQSISFLYLSLLVFMGTRLVTFFNSKKYLVFFGNAGVGVLFIGFAVSLMMAKV